MKPIKISELIRMLEADGWREVRQKGSHRQFQHPTKRGVVTVAGKMSATVKIGTLMKIMKDAGLRKVKHR